MGISAPPVLTLHCALKLDHLLDENDEQQAAFKEVVRKRKNLVSFKTESLFYQGLPQRGQNLQKSTLKKLVKNSIFQKKRVK